MDNRAKMSHQLRLIEPDCGAVLAWNLRSRVTPRGLLFNIAFWDLVSRRKLGIHSKQKARVHPSDDRHQPGREHG